MAYGPGYMNYRQDVDVARIRAAGFSVEEKGAVAIIRVTDKLSDVVDDFAHFSRRRAELKSLFRPDLFAIKHEPGSGDLLPGPKVLSAAEMRGETELP